MELMLSTDKILEVLQAAGWNIQFCGTAFEEADRNYRIVATLGGREHHAVWQPGIVSVNDAMVKLAAEIGIEGN